MAGSPLEAARVTGEAVVVSMYPDVCLTPAGSGMVPVPYTIVARFDQSVRQRTTVRFGGDEAMTNYGRLQSVTGDEPGTGGGITSGVNLGMCRPQTHSSTVRVNGQPVIRHSGLIEMNCAGPEGPSNTVGSIVYPLATGAQPRVLASGEIEGETDPPLEPETEEEKGWWERRMDNLRSAGEAVKSGAQSAGSAVRSGAEWAAENPLDALQGGLDVVGMVPVAGELADGANALISVGRGNYAEAALSAAAMWPAGGQAATAGKLAMKYGDEAAGAAGAALRHGDEAGDAAGAAARQSDEAAEAAARQGDEAAEAAARQGDELPQSGDGVVVTQPPRREPTYQTPHQPLSARERRELREKLEDRTITREEYERLEWDRRFGNRRDRGVDRFWSEERSRLRDGQPGTRNWSPEQRDAILSGRRPRFEGETLQGHHGFNALDHPHIADDPSHIYPATPGEHLRRWHGGNWRNDTSGSPLRPDIPEDF